MFAKHVLLFFHMSFGAALRIDEGRSLRVLVSAPSVSSVELPDPRPRLESAFLFVSRACLGRAPDARIGDPTFRPTRDAFLFLFVADED